MLDGADTVRLAVTCTVIFERAHDVQYLPGNVMLGGCQCPMHGEGQVWAEITGAAGVARGAGQHEERCGTFGETAVEPELAHAPLGKAAKSFQIIDSVFYAHEPARFAEFLNEIVAGNRALLVNKRRQGGGVGDRMEIIAETGIAQIRMDRRQEQYGIGPYLRGLPCHEDGLTDGGTGRSENHGISARRCTGSTHALDY